MLHTYACPMRWSDMDQLGHVNNVTYLEYVAEARHRALAGDGVATAGAPATVPRHRVEFVRPLVYRPDPVLVDTWVTRDDDGVPALQHEVHDITADGERVVHLRVSSDLEPDPTGSWADSLARLEDERPAHAWRPTTPAGEPRPGDEFPLATRLSDLDGRGRASDVRLVEYFQESRIQYFARLHEPGQEWPHHVVARTDVDLLGPVPHRVEPYLVRSWVAHLGDRSFTVASELSDGERALARASVVMVTFDRRTQRTRPMPASQHERLARELARR